MLFFSAINKSRSQAVPLATIGSHWLIGSIGSIGSQFRLSHWPIGCHWLRSTRALSLQLLCCAARSNLLNIFSTLPS